MLTTNKNEKKKSTIAVYLRFLESKIYYLLKILVGVQVMLSLPRIVFLYELDLFQKGLDIFSY